MNMKRIFGVKLATFSLFVIAVIALRPDGTRAEGGPVRRAVVVGIDHYGTAAVPSAAPAREGRLVPKVRTGQRSWSDLDVAVNDARVIQALLIGRLGFAANQVIVLQK